MAPGDAGNNTRQERTVEEVSSWEKCIGQTHRRMSLLFTAAVVGVTAAVLAQDEPAGRVCLMPLLPLAPVMATGLCIFALPHVAGRRSSAEGSGDG